MNGSDAIAALHALAHEHRLSAHRALVRAGSAGMAVGALRDELGIAPATLSAHLNVLRAAGLVTDEREGRVIRVRADFRRIDALIAFLTENCCAGTECAPPAAESARRRGAARVR